MALPLVTPPASYGLVAPGIYRSNTPPSHTFPFLRTLHLRTAVILSPEQPTRALVQFFEECGTTLVQVSCVPTHRKPVYDAGSTAASGSAAAAAASLAAAVAATTVTPSSHPGGAAGPVPASVAAAAHAATAAGISGAPTRVPASALHTAVTTQAVAASAGSVFPPSTGTPMAPGGGLPGGTSSPASTPHGGRRPTTPTSGSGGGGSSSGGPADPGTAASAPLTIGLGLGLSFGFNLGAADTWRPISDRLVKDVLELVLDRTRHPLLLMCSSGVYETGIVVGCLRRLQGWSLTSILSEYGNVAATAGRMPRVGHEQFVELFDLDLITLPPHLPSWFETHLRLLNEEADAAARAHDHATAEAVDADAPPDASAVC